MISEKIVQIEAELGDPAMDGNFSLGTKWETCRERFQSAFNTDLMGFYYSIGTADVIEVNALEMLNEFIGKIEDILSAYVDLSIRTVFSRTIRPYVCYVEPSNYWKTGWYHKSLFTLLLRSGLKYKQKGIEQALSEYSLSKESLPSILRFLMGYTIVTKFDDHEGSQYGWVELFKNKSILEIRKLLVRQRKPEEEDIFVGFGTIIN